MPFLFPKSISSSCLQTNNSLFLRVKTNPLWPRWCFPLLSWFSQEAFTPSLSSPPAASPHHSDLTSTLPLTTSFAKSMVCFSPPRNPAFYSPAPKTPLYLSPFLITLPHTGFSLLFLTVKFPKCSECLLF